MDFHLTQIPNIETQLVQFYLFLLITFSFSIFAQISPKYCVIYLLGKNPTLSEEFLADPKYQ